MATTDGSGASAQAGLPRSGAVLRLTTAASVQFTVPILFRVIRVHDWSTYDDWAWLDGYQLNSAAEAVERRSVSVRVPGLHDGSGMVRSSR